MYALSKQKTLIKIDVLFVQRSNMEYKEIIKSAYYYDKTGMLLKGDCLEWMEKFPDNSIDMILADLPYGTTKCKWDIIIPFDKLWKQYERIIKKNGAFVFTGSQPFTSLLITSKIDWFKYEIIWEKDKPSDFALAPKRTMKYHENVLIFCEGVETYNPQMTQGIPNHSVGKGIRKKNNESGANTAIVSNKTDGLKHPKSVIKFNRESSPIHPTQKPVLLFEYLIKTYTNEGMLVLDNTAGVCTTAIASKNTGRRWICIEQEEKYCNLSLTRLKS